LSDKVFMHVFDSNFVFLCEPKLDLRQYNIAI
jgi:hypothetical protein